MAGTRVRRAWSGLACFPVGMGSGPCRAIGSHCLLHADIYEKRPCLSGRRGRGKVWGAEKPSFCQKFLLPLALLLSVSVRLMGLSPSGKLLLTAQSCLLACPPSIHCLSAPAPQASLPSDP